MTENRKIGSRKHSDLLMQYYFAYGSNLNWEQFHNRCPDARMVCPAVLHGWRLAERQFADIEKDDESLVHGALYAISPADLEMLDYYEGYPEGYTRQELPVVRKDGQLLMALAYMMTPAWRRELEGVPYSRTYRQICSDGAAFWNIPDAFSSGEETFEKNCCQ